MLINGRRLLFRARLRVAHWPGGSGRQDRLRLPAGLRAARAPRLPLPAVQSATTCGATGLKTSCSPDTHGDPTYLGHGRHSGRGRDRLQGTAHARQFVACAKFNVVLAAAQRKPGPRGCASRRSSKYNLTRWGCCGGTKRAEYGLTGALPVWLVAAQRDFRVRYADFLADDRT
jgi:hypothetical protein